MTYVFTYTRLHIDHVFQREPMRAQGFRHVWLRCADAGGK